VELGLTSGNLRGALPPEIGQLVNLHDLALSHNLLLVLPPEICRLTRLQTLFLSNSRLTKLSENIGQLANLKVFGNQLPGLPVGFDQLTGLEELWLHSRLGSHVGSE